MSKTDWEKLAAALRFRASASPITLSTAVEFLEADPWFHSSGYIKAKLIKFINRQELKPDWVRRLQKVVIASVDREDRREFRSYCRLACKVDSAKLRGELMQRLEHEDKSIRRHARWVLDYLKEEKT